MKRFEKIFFKCFVATVSLICSFLLLFCVEQLAWVLTEKRIVKYYRPITIEMQERVMESNGDYRLTNMLVAEQFEPDPVMLWKPARSVYPFDDQGFVSRPLYDNLPDDTANIEEHRKLTILAIGDSNTQGIGKTSWAEELGYLMKTSGIAVDVINAGVSGYTSYQGLLRLKNILPTVQPDVVIISFGWNDAAPNSNIQDKEFAGLISSNIRFLYQSRLYLVLKHYMHKMRQDAAKEDKDYQSPRVTLEDYERNLKEIVMLVKERGAVPVLMTRPYKYSDFELSRIVGWRTHVSEYNVITSRVAHELNTPLVPMRKLFEKRKNNFFIDECHFSVAGNVVAANTILELLYKWVLIPA